MKTSLLSSGSSECLYGGVKIESGIDENKNGILDDNEVDKTQYVCHGSPGGSGTLADNKTYHKLQGFVQKGPYIQGTEISVREMYPYTLDDNSSTLIFTGKNINFGNYSCLTKNDTKVLSTKKSLWSSFSGSVKKHIPKLNTINSIRGPRYFGPSKMSLFNLGIHSLSIIAVFKLFVFIRSAILALIIYYFRDHIGFLLFVISIALLIFFNLMIYLVSFRENKKDLLDSGENIADTKSYTH